MAKHFYKAVVIAALTLICLQQGNAQNVGIGTKTPLYKLTIQTPGNSWGMMHTDSTVYIGSYVYPAGAGGLGTRSHHPFYLFANNNDTPPAITIDNNGINVGIGNLTPAYSLDLHSAGNAQFNIAEGTAGQTALFSRYSNRLEIQPSDALQISVGGIDRKNLCVANNGYVGISTATPLNYLQVGNYTSAGIGGNQIAYGLGTNVTVMNQYAGYSNFLSTTSLNIQSGHDIYLMPNNGNGHVGINTNTPSYPLVVSGNLSSWGTDNKQASIYPLGGQILNTFDEGYVAIYANGSIEADEYYAISDRRIKDIIGITNTKNDLETLNKLIITDYTMKDKKTYGNKSFKKVIAQEVEEVYPQAVSRQVNFIPNTYLQTDKIIKTDSGYVLHFTKAHNLSKNATFIKVYSNKGDAKLPVQHVLSEYDVAVKAANLNDHLFMYGEQVNDFEVVDYEGLTTLNISATQQLSKLIMLQQKEIDALKEEIKLMKAKESYR